MKVKSIAECSIGAFCNTFDLHKAIKHKAIIGLESQFVVFFLSCGLRKFVQYRCKIVAVRGLNVDPTLDLYPYLVYSSSEGSGKYVHHVRIQKFLSEGVQI